MSLIQVKNLTFTYDGSYEPVFENASFQIDTGWRLGLIGRNGRGKTTLLRLLCGTYPYQGTISASTPVSYFPYLIRRPEAPAIDAVSEMEPDYELWRLQCEMEKLRLDESILLRSYATLSGGEQTKLQLAVLFSSEQHYLLIDEPTNHLDLPGRELVSRYLSRKRGFLLVSHDRAFLDGCVDHILSINRADIQVCRGNFSTWMENRERQDAFEQRKNEKLLREIARLQDTAREKTQWAGRAEARKIGSAPADRPDNYRSYQGAKAERTMARAKAIEKRREAALEEKKLLLKNLERREELKLVQLPFIQSGSQSCGTSASHMGRGLSAIRSAFRCGQGSGSHCRGRTAAAKAVSFICCAAWTSRMGARSGVAAACAFPLSGRTRRGSAAARQS